MTIRNLPESTRQALKRRAERPGRSTEAEIRAILEEAVHPVERIGIGSKLAAFGKLHGGLELQIERDKKPVKAPSFK